MLNIINRSCRPPAPAPRHSQWGTSASVYSSLKGTKKHNQQSRSPKGPWRQHKNGNVVSTEVCKFLLQGSVGRALVSCDSLSGGRLPWTWCCLPGTTPAAPSHPHRLSASLVPGLWARGLEGSLEGSVWPLGVWAFEMTTMPLSLLVIQVPDTPSDLFPRLPGGCPPGVLRRDGGS